jgi:hypothetical protein
MIEGPIGSSIYCEVTRLMLDDEEGVEWKDDAMASISFWITLLTTATPSSISSHQVGVEYLGVCRPRWQM